MRIAKYLASAGLGSRRACERFVEAGRVSVNGERVCTPAHTIDPGKDDVRLSGRPVRPKPLRTILLYKPRGYTCSDRDEHAVHLVAELLPSHLRQLHTVGRLDQNSEGLLLCTNDGQLAHRMTHPRYGVRKTYRVRVKGAVSDAVPRVFRDGIVDRGERLQALETRVVQRRGRESVLEVVMGEGKKREVRRLCRQVGLEVLRLRRTKLGRLTLRGLAPGQWRELTPAEVRSLRRDVGLAARDAP